MKYLLIILLLFSEPVINPDNVKPGSWFTPTSTQQQQQLAEQEAFRQLVCALQGKECK